MLKNLVRLLSWLMMFSSTASAAQSLDNVFENLQEQIDFSKVDTGFETDEEKYAFGARRDLSEIDEDLTINVGVAAKYKNSQEYNLSRASNNLNSQTNRMEEQTNPAAANPMIGASIGYKF